MQDLFPFCLDVAADLILHFGGFGAGTGRECENMAVEEPDLFQKFGGFVKIFFALAGEAYDDVSREGDIRKECAKV